MERRSPPGTGDFPLTQHRDKVHGSWSIHLMVSGYFSNPVIISIAEK